jgi:hypothetical protein
MWHFWKQSHEIPIVSSLMPTAANTQHQPLALPTVRTDKATDHYFMRDLIYYCKLLCK